MPRWEGGERFGMFGATIWNGKLYTKLITKLCNESSFIIYICNMYRTYDIETCQCQDFSVFSGNFCGMFHLTSSSDEKQMGKKCHPSQGIVLEWNLQLQIELPLPHG